MALAAQWSVILSEVQSFMGAPLCAKKQEGTYRLWSGMVRGFL